MFTKNSPLIFFKKSIKRTVLIRYKEFWAQFRRNNNDGILRTYFSLKDHFQTEQYLSVIKNLINGVA